MVYGALRTLFRVVLDVFYRRVEVVGLEHVPSRGPLIVTANHQNALVDPMLLVAALPRRLRPVAKAPLFRHPVIAPFLHAIGAIPVHRRQESAGTPVRNDELFHAAAATLAAGGAILIFPEGVSQPEPVLMPLRTGAARMLLAADEVVRAQGAADGVTLLAVGLVLHDPGTFRTGRALVVVGPPVATRDLAGRGASDETAVREITSRLDAALRDVIVEAENRETLRLLALLEAIAATDDEPDAAARATWMRRAMSAYRRLQTIAADRAARFRAELERYAKDADLAGVSPTHPGRRYRAGAVWRFTVREGAALIGALPLALWGMVVHAVPYHAAGVAARGLRPEPDVEATYKIIASVLFYPLAWLAEAWLAWRLGGAPLVVFFLLALLPSGFLALTWRERLARFATEARAFLRFVFDRDLDAQLAARRAALVAEMRELARLAESG